MENGFKEMRFKKELYSKIALLKAAYNYTDRAYLHLDADDQYYFVRYKMKNSEDAISHEDFLNEMLAQSIRHEIYCRTKNIRELIYARAMASSVVFDDNLEPDDGEPADEQSFSEDEILKDWFDEHDGSETQ